MKLNVSNQQIALLFIIFGILGFIMEIIYPTLSRFCIKEGEKTTRYFIYILVVFIGIKMRRSLKADG